MRDLLSTFSNHLNITDLAVVDLDCMCYGLNNLLKHIFEDYVKDNGITLDFTASLKLAGKTRWVNKYNEVTPRFPTGLIINLEHVAKDNHRDVLITLLEGIRLEDANY
eukprot:Awhi_evm1s12352